MINLDNLKIYKKAFELGDEIYKITKKFPNEEKYGLISQLRRAGSSIGANIAEGAGRKTRADFHRFLYIAAGSLKETQYYLDLAKSNSLADEKTLDSLIRNSIELGKMLTSFIKNSY